MGVERLIDSMKESGLSVINKDILDLYFIQVGDEAKKIALPLSIEARDRGLKVSASFGSPSMKTQLKKANQLNARYVSIIGIMEARRGVCQLKDMATGIQKEVKLAELIDTMIDIVGEKHLDFYDPMLELFRAAPAVVIAE